MADVKKAVDNVLREEDALLTGRITDTPGDTGGLTRFGLASRWHPELKETTFYSTMSVDDAMQVAVLTLERDYAVPLRIADLTDEVLASKYLSFGVNAGPETATRALQNAVNGTVGGFKPTLYVDGKCGPDTIAAANACMEQSLRNSFRLRMVGYYNSLCRANASQLKFLCGWIDRALA